MERLKRRPDFLRVAAARRKWVTPGLILQARRRRPGEAQEDGQRVGFTASRKVGNAVTRNRARRRLMALADRLLPVYGAAGHDYVLIARAATPQRPFAALTTDLRTALERLGEQTAEGKRKRTE